MFNNIKILKKCRLSIFQKETENVVVNIFLCRICGRCMGKILNIKKKKKKHQTISVSKKRKKKRQQKILENSVIIIILYEI